DGYWLLADLTGVPDFFSQMGPFVKSMLPIPGPKGHELPDMKPWVRLIFTLFLILTIPVLAVLFVLMIVGFPAVLATTWDSMQAQLGVLSEAIERRSVVPAVLSALQLLLLSLPILGTIYLIVVMARPVLAALWGW